MKDFSLLPGVHWILQVDMAGLEGLEGQKVDNVEPVNQLVFLAVCRL